MTTPPASKATAAIDGETSVNLTLEDRLRIFWEKNSKAVIGVVVLVLVAVVAKGGWEYMQAQKEIEIEHDYASAISTDALKTFAAKNSGHSLAGIAKLRVADDAYASGLYAEAISGYENAIPALKDPALVSRAKLGAAMSKLQAGKPEGEAALKAIASDTSEIKAVRVEAAYHLASLASSQGKAADVRKYASEIMGIDPTSPWTQRAFMLSATLPVEPEAVGSVKIPIK